MANENMFNEDLLIKYATTSDSRNGFVGKAAEFFTKEYRVIMGEGTRKIYEKTSAYLKDISYIATHLSSRTSQEDILNLYPDTLAILRMHIHWLYETYSIKLFPGYLYAISHAKHSEPLTFHMHLLDFWFKCMRSGYAYRLFSRGIKELIEFHRQQVQLSEKMSYIHIKDWLIDMDYSLASYIVPQEVLHRAWANTVRYLMDTPAMETNDSYEYTLRYMYESYTSTEDTRWIYSLQIFNYIDILTVLTWKLQVLHDIMENYSNDLEKHFLVSCNRKKSALRSCYISTIPAKAFCELGTGFRDQSSLKKIADVYFPRIHAFGKRVEQQLDHGLRMDVPTEQMMAFSAHEIEIEAPHIYDMRRIYTTRNYDAMSASTDRGLLAQESKYLYGYHGSLFDRCGDHSYILEQQFR